MTASDKQSVTHDGTCPTQAGFVPRAVQESGHVQVWPHSVTSPTPDGAAPCALTQMLIELLKPAVEAQTKAPLASPKGSSCEGMPQQHAAKDAPGSAEQRGERCRFGSQDPVRAPPQLATPLLCHCEGTAITTLLRNVHRIMCYVHMHPLLTNR